MVEFLVLFFVFYVWHSLGVTVGYHRLLSHRSFSCPKFVEYFWVLAGYLAFEGSPIWWATMHRAHHRYVDTPLDPHSPRFGIEHARAGWIRKVGYSEMIDPHTHSKDLVKDPVYRFLEREGVFRKSHFMCFSIGIGLRVLMVPIFGWIPALASILAGFAVLQIPLMLNVACHIPKLGYKNYQTDDDSVNVWWVALLATGEGWHNNHHACPGSAKTGMRYWEFDLAWLTIALMKRLGLVSRVTVCTEEQHIRGAQRRNEIAAPTLAALKSAGVYVASVEPSVTVPEERALVAGRR